MARVKPDNIGQMPRHVAGEPLFQFFDKHDLITPSENPATTGHAHIVIAPTKTASLLYTSLKKKVGPNAANRNADPLTADPRKEKLQQTAIIPPETAKVLPKSLISLLLT